MTKQEGTLLRTVAISALLAGLSFDSSALAAVLRVPGDYPTIQAAVNAAALSGDEILISPGVYVEQVVVTGKKLILTGSAGTILKAWTGMKWEPPAPYYALVDMRDNADVVLRYLELDGQRLATSMSNRNACFLGVVFNSSGGRVENCVISGFRGVNNLARAVVQPIGGRGVGVIAVNNAVGATCKHVRILNNIFSDNGYSILLPGAWIDGSSELSIAFVIKGNAITGVGPTTLDYQMGIGINPTASGVIKGNTITGHYNDNPSGIWSCGIIRSVAPPLALPLRIEANSFVENEAHVIAVQANSAQVIHNTFEGSPTGRECKGAYLTGTDIRIAANQFTNLSFGIVLSDEDDPELVSGCGRAINPLVLANRFCDVSTRVYSRPLVTGLLELGTEVCPPTQPGTLSCSPARGLPGATVTLTGANLAGATTVLFNGLNAQFTSGTDPNKQIVATVPGHATTGPVTVITPQANITSLDPFTVPVPLLLKLQAGNRVQLSWCTEACDLLLQTTSDLATSWKPASLTPSVGVDRVIWEGPLESGPRFFRLR